MEKSVEFKVVASPPPTDEFGHEVKPFRKDYRHGKCGCVTRMSPPLSMMYGDPPYFATLLCAACKRQLPMDEFVWADDGSEIAGARP